MVPPFPIAVHKLIVLSLEDIEVMIKNQERIRGISVQDPKREREINKYTEEEKLREKRNEVEKEHLNELCVCVRDK